MPSVGGLTKFITPAGDWVADPAAGAGVAVTETAASAKTGRMMLVNIIVRIGSCEDVLAKGTTGVPFYTVSPRRRTCA